jgi:hypothetical protein
MQVSSNQGGGAEITTALGPRGLIRGESDAQQGVELRPAPLRERRDP